MGARRAHARDQPKAAEIAREAAGEERFVAGSIGPTGHLPACDDPTLGKITFRELVEVFTEQAAGLVEGGADLIIIETAQDILEVKAAIFGAREAFKADGPHACRSRLSVSLLPQGRQDAAGHRHPGRAHHARRRSTSTSIGLNCSTGPEDMRDAIRFLGEHCPLPVHCIPNAGLPLQGPEGETIFPEEPEPLADDAAGVRGALRRRRSSAAAAAPRPTTSRRSSTASAAAGRRRGPRAGPPHGLLA